MPGKKGVLLVNLGTPDNCSPKAVRKYLQEFLSDPRVIDIPWLFRFILLYCYILPFRPKRTAEAYEAIWTAAGSPLAINSMHLKEKLQLYLGENYQVSLAMRYGKPALEKTLTELDNCSQITIIPLYPQYSSAATGSSLQKALQILSLKENIPNFQVVKDFFNHPGFIKPYASLIAPYLSSHDYLLFSYHGLPERQLTKIGCKIVCKQACPVLSSNNSACYRAQCQHTTSLIANELGLSADKYSFAFQSRLGRTPWIEPYTDQVLPQLIAQNIRRLAIVCPSFVADCLETLEEIGIRAAAQWQALGGETLTLIPCLNADDNWVAGLAELVP